MVWAGSWNEAISYCDVLATRLRVATRGYASNLRLRVPVFVVFCHGGCIIERGNFLFVGYGSTRGYPVNLLLRVVVFGVFRDHQFKLVATLRSRLRVNKKKSRGILQFSPFRPNSKIQLEILTRELVCLVLSLCGTISCVHLHLTFLRQIPN